MKTLPLIVALALGAIVASAIGQSQLTHAISQVFRIEYQPHPRDYVEITAEQMPFQLPIGKMLVIRGLSGGRVLIGHPTNELFLFRTSDNPAPLTPGGPVRPYVLARTQSGGLSDIARDAMPAVQIPDGQLIVPGGASVWMSSGTLLSGEGNQNWQNYAGTIIGYIAAE